MASNEPKPYKIIFAPEATEEIENIFLYIAEDSPQNATAWYFSIYEKIQTLKTFPLRCPVAFENHYYDYEIRHLILDNYRVLYRIQKQTVQILHIRHGAQERSIF